MATLSPSLDPLELNSDSTPHRLKRIVAGEKANVNSWPWVVGVYIREHGESYFRCAGALIDKRFVLTSAYCVHGIPIDSVVVSIGSSLLSSNSNNGRFENVDGIKVHDDYSFDDEHRENDIALLRLKKSVIFSPIISSICLPKSPDPTLIYEKNVVVAGWYLDIF